MAIPKYITYLVLGRKICIGMKRRKYHYVSLLLIPDV
jgi:hypothetical protein